MIFLKVNRPNFKHFKQ